VAPGRLAIAVSFVVWPLVRALARERALGGVMAAPDAIFPGPLNYTRFRRAFGRPIAA